MKRFVYIFLILYGILGCATHPPTPKEPNTLTFEKNEEEKYDIIVLDSSYDSYLISMAKPMNFYSEEYYKSRNHLYVTEWNLRVSQPFRYDPNFYSMQIDYSPTKDYGINLEYKLYNYFQFIKYKYKVTLDFGR